MCLKGEAEEREGKRVYIRANRLGEISVVQRGRVSVPVDYSLVYDGVYLVGCDPGTDVRCGEVEDFSCELFDTDTRIS